MTKAKAKKKQQRAQKIKARRHAGGNKSGHAALYRQGLLAWQKGDLGLAQSFLEEVIALHPTPEAYRVLGAVKFSQQPPLYEEAEQAFRAALALRPTYALAHAGRSALIGMSDNSLLWYCSRKKA